MTRLLGIVMVALASAPAHHTAPPDCRGAIDADEAVRRYEAALQTAQSFDVIAQVTMRTLFHSERSYDDDISLDDNRKRAQNVRVIFTSRKLRPGEVGPSHEWRTHQLYDQGKGKIEVLDESGRILSGHVSRQEGLGLPGVDYRETMHCVFGGVTHDFLKCFRERRGHIVVNGLKDASQLLMIEALPVTGPAAKGIGYAGWSFRVGLDPEKGMMPAVLEVWQPVASKLRLYRRTSIERWKKTTAGTWVPIKAITRIFYIDPGDKELDGEVGNEIVLSVDESRSSWNLPIPDDKLRVRLPAREAVPSKSGQDPKPRSRQGR
jgi:hypothetical protein